MKSESDTPQPERISFRCSCGQELKVKTAAVGKRLQCRSCQKILRVPNAAKSVKHSVPNPPASHARSNHSMLVLLALFVVLVSSGIWFAVVRSEGMKLDATNASIAAAVATAQNWVADDSLDGVDSVLAELQAATKHESPAKTEEAIQLLPVVEAHIKKLTERTAQQEETERLQLAENTLQNDIQQFFAKSQVNEAISLLEEYLQRPTAIEKDRFAEVLAEARLSVSDEQAVALLADLESDPSQRVSSLQDSSTADPILQEIVNAAVQTPALRMIYYETLKRNVELSANIRRQAIAELTIGHRGEIGKLLAKQAAWTECLRASENTLPAVTLSELQMNPEAFVNKPVELKNVLYFNGGIKKLPELGAWELEVVEVFDDGSKVTPDSKVKVVVGDEIAAHLSSDGEKAMELECVVVKSTDLWSDILPVKSGSESNNYIAFAVHAGIRPSEGSLKNMIDLIEGRQWKLLNELQAFGTSDEKASTGRLISLCTEVANSGRTDFLPDSDRMLVGLMLKRYSALRIFGDFTGSEVTLRIQVQFLSKQIGGSLSEEQIQILRDQFIPAGEQALTRSRQGTTFDNRPWGEDPTSYFQSAIAKVDGNVEKASETLIEDEVQLLTRNDAINEGDARTQLSTRFLTQMAEALKNGDVPTALIEYRILRQLGIIVDGSLEASFARLSSELLEQIPTSIILAAPAIENAVGMKLKLIPVGTGSYRPDFSNVPQQANNSYAAGFGGYGQGTAGYGERQRFEVAVPYYMGTHEVTQKQFETIMGEGDPGDTAASDNAATATWDEAVEFCRLLSELPEEKLAGRSYRLPTETEWENSCRAGSSTRYSFGDTADKLGDFAWFQGNSDSLHPHAVGLKLPNQWGFFDMFGNAAEWCIDGYEPLRVDRFSAGAVAVNSPRDLRDDTARVIRGGSWKHPAELCRSSSREFGPPKISRKAIGFRVVCDAP